MTTDQAVAIEYAAQETTYLSCEIGANEDLSKTGARLHHYPTNSYWEEFDFHNALLYLACMDHADPNYHGGIDLTGTITKMRTNNHDQT